MRRFTLILLLAIGLSVDAQQPRKRVLISTDFGMGLQGGWRALVDQDDGWVVGMALADKTLDVDAIVTVLGNSNVAPEQAASEHLVRQLLKRRDVALAAGAAVKLDNPQATLNGVALKRDCWNPGVELLARQLRRAAATIVAIGPLTDVACLAMNAPPNVVRNIREVIAIMGRAPNEPFVISGKGGLSDFNLVMDDRAVQVLLDETQVPMTFLQFSVTKSSLITRGVVEALGGDPVQDYYRTTTLPWIDWWQQHFGENGFHPWDSNAVYYAANPMAYSCGTVQYRLVSCADSSPYNRNPACAGHGPTQPPSLDKEATQLWLAPALGSARTVTACTAYRDDAAKAAFTEAAGRWFKSRVVR